MIYILTIKQEQTDKQWLSFQSLEAGSEFLSQLPGYRTETEDYFTYEWIRTDLFPDYDEIEFRGSCVPVSKFMFSDWGEMGVYFTEIPCLDIEHQGLIDGVTTIDAYSIPNDEMKKYIETRERTFEIVSRLLKEKNIETTRSYHGSEDGEAILYRPQGESEWYLLDHMDPAFVEMGKKGEDSIKLWLQSFGLKG